MENRNKSIGVFDSGIGGLTAVKELIRLMPHENVIYFGDTARFPYGCRSRETILKYAAEDVAFLKTHDIKMIIAACGTVSSVIGDGTDNVLAGDLPFTGVLMPAARAACAATKNGKIGVIGTLATIKSGSYDRAVKSIMPVAEVFGQACPLFAPLAENGYTERGNAVASLVTEEYLAPVRDSGADVLILGCTHYPLLRGIISDYMGEGVTLISPGGEAAKFAQKLLSERGLLNNSGKIGEHTYYVSDSPETFDENAALYLGHEVKGKLITEKDI